MASDPSSCGAWLYERHQALVLEAFRRGEFDYLEAVGEVAESDFFRAIAQKKVLEKLAETYPSPCQKHDVPLWVYIAGNLSMRFHGEHHFHAFPYVVRSGGLVQAFGPRMGHKVTHPQTGDVSLRCEGFNDKNDCDRQTPCDQDYLRKMGRRTDAGPLQGWFNRDVVGLFRQHHALDPEGIFIGDATYLFVPDNPNYEGSMRLLLDAGGHPVESRKVSATERAGCQRRRCYKPVSLIHTNRAAEFFLYAALQVVSGSEHEAPILYQRVEDFVGFHGRGVMKRLIVDRGFLDGAALARCHSEGGIRVLVPARRNQDLYQDVVGPAEAGELSFQVWEAPPAAASPLPVHRPERVKKREAARQKTSAARQAAQPAPDPSGLHLRSEVALVSGLETFSSCPIPLQALVNREVYGDGHYDYRVLLDTGPVSDPARIRRDYALRTTIEERHRQLKGFSDLDDFSSRAFNLIVNQVVFVLLTYSLLQWYGLRLGRKELNSKTRTRTLELLRPTSTVILIYWQGYVACLTPLEHQELLLTLAEPARKKILAKTRRLRRSLVHQLDQARAP